MTTDGRQIVTRNPAAVAEAHVKVTAQRLRDTWHVEYERYKEVLLAAARSAAEAGEPSRPITVARPPDVARYSAPVENPEAKLDTRGKVMSRSDIRWDDAARRAIELKIHPETYVRQQFAALSPPARPPVASNLFGPVAMQRYAESRGTQVDEVRLALQSQISAFGAETMGLVHAKLGPMTLESAWAWVIGHDHDRRLSALFRYCTATGMVTDRRVTDTARFERLADEYRVAAAVQYVIDADAYDEVWKTFLPAGWRGQADRLYANYYGLRYGEEA